MARKEIKVEEKAEGIKKAILQHQKPSIEQYLIGIGRSLNNYTYDPIKIMNNVKYFIGCYNNDVKVADALHNFSKI